MKLDTIPLPLHTGSEHGPEREGFAYHDGFADFTPDLAGRLLREQRALHSAVARRATWLLQGSRGDTGRHGGAAWAPHGAAAGETQDALAVAAVAVWAPHKAGVWASLRSGKQGVGGYLRVAVGEQQGALQCVSRAIGRLAGAGAEGRQ